jgi:hypothetical protein
MCDERVLKAQKILQCPATRVPKIVVQKVEEMYPCLKEGTVSVLCSCVINCIVFFPAFKGPGKVIL